MRKILWVWLVVFGITQLHSQETNNPFSTAIELTGISKSELFALAPHLPNLEKAKLEPMKLIQTWIDKYPDEWSNFLQHEKVVAANISWVTIGLNKPETSPKFSNSFWNWYLASGISEGEAHRLFPNFPKPQITKNPSADKTNYSNQLGAWMRLYPKQYETFLNAPQIARLNPYHQAGFKLNYRPKFLGQRIGSTQPVKTNSGDPIVDEYEYQLKIRNWYFVYEPGMFNQLYGGDYDFPEDFDFEFYRGNMKESIRRHESGEYPHTPFEDK